MRTYGVAETQPEGTRENEPDFNVLGNGERVHSILLLSLSCLPELTSFNVAGERIPTRRYSH